MEIREKLGDFILDDRNKIVVVITEFGTKYKLDIRNWYLIEPEKIWIATKKGTSFEIKHIPDLIKVLQAVNLPLLEEENYKKIKCREIQREERKKIKLEKKKQQKTFIP